MKIKEVTESVNFESDKLMSDLSLKKIMSIIQSKGLDSDARAASIKNKILNKWENGHRNFKHYEPDLTRLGIKWKDLIK